MRVRYVQIARTARPRRLEYWQTPQSYLLLASTNRVINHLSETIGKYQVNRAREPANYAGSRTRKNLLGIVAAAAIVRHYTSWWCDENKG